MPLSVAGVPEHECAVVRPLAVPCPASISGSAMIGEPVTLDREHGAIGHDGVRPVLAPSAKAVVDAQFALLDGGHAAVGVRAEQPHAVRPRSCAAWRGNRAVLSITPSIRRIEPSAARR